ncbi:hypothetical protein HOG48_02355 [Candidatus Peregrinibacteria bacterium]|nr:hypothetical protein [Candidatus Peregrinibacteria bacterium]
MQIIPSKDRRSLTAEDIKGISLPAIPQDPERKTASESLSEEKMHPAIILLSVLIHAAVMGGFLAVETPSNRLEQSALTRPRNELSLSEIMARISEEDSHNAAVLAQLRSEINQFFDSLIDIYMDPNHEDYVGKDGSYVLPPVEVFAKIDGYRRVVEYAEARGEVGGKIDEENLQELQKERETQIIETHDERIEMIVEDINFTWECDPKEDMYNVQFGLYGGTRDNQYRDRYFHPAHGEPGRFPHVTPYKSDHRFLSDQHRDGMVNCTSARMTPWVFEAAYSEHCPDMVEPVMGSMGTMLWGDHIFSSYQEPDGALYTLRDIHVTKPFVKGVQPAGAQSPGVEHDLIAHLAAYMTDSGLITEQQVARLYELGAFKPTEGDYLEGETSQYATPLLQYNEILDNGGWSAPEEPELKVDTMEHLRDVTTGDVLNAYMYDHFWTIMQGSHMEPIKDGQQIQFISWQHPILESPHIILENNKWIFLIGEYKSKMFSRGLGLHSQFNPRLEAAYEDFLERVDELEIADGIGLQEWFVAIHSVGLEKVMLKRASENPDFIDKWLDGYQPIVDHFPEGSSEEGIAPWTAYEVARYADHSEFLAKHTGDERYLQHVDRAREKAKSTPRTLVAQYTVGEIERMSQEEIYALCDLNGFDSEAYGGRYVRMTRDLEGHIAFAHRLSEDPARFVTMLNGEVFRHWDAFIFLAPAIERAMANDDGTVGMEPYNQWYEAIVFEELSYQNPLKQQLDLRVGMIPLTWYAILDTPTLPHVQAFVRGIMDRPDVINTFSVFSNLVGVYLGLPQNKEEGQEVSLETSDDFDALMKNPFDDISTDVNQSGPIPYRGLDFDMGPSPGLYFKLKKIYVKEPDQQRRLKMLGKLALLQNRHLCIKKEDLYAEDLAFIRSIPVQGLWTIAHETMDSRALGRRLKVLYDEEAITAAVIAEYSGMTSHNRDYAEEMLQVIAELNPELWLRLHEEINESNY